MVILDGYEWLLLGCWFMTLVFFLGVGPDLPVVGCKLYCFGGFQTLHWQDLEPGIHVLPIVVVQWSFAYSSMMNAVLPTNCAQQFPA